MTAPEPCPSEADLDAYVRGALAGDALARVEAHVAACSDCRQVVALLASAPTPAPAALSRLLTFGRYVILEAIGAGAMGAVYLAYDPDLDRKVALKLVQAPDAGEQSRDRLLREAKAMAKVKHPNVVGVFDAGVHGDHVYIAMELVEGTSLSKWLAGGPRADAVVDRFVAAGRGLAAAHAAGLVHRDFKPDNVLVGRDGQVYVTDFGLAQADPSAPAPGATPATGATIANVIAGTPVYMAPEQLRGQRADARSDQWAFCVALCEGLSGRRPFTGGTVDDLLGAALRGPTIPSHVPRRLRRALARGLSADPADRFPSMDALLAELSGWRRRRTRAAFGAVGLAVVAVASVAIGLREPGCGALAASEAEGLWAPRREAVRAAFDASGSAGAATAFEGVDRVVSKHLEDYRFARTATCEAGAPADDPRATCLAERRRELSALFDVLGAADASVVPEAVLAAHGVRPIGLCADLETAAGALAPATPEADAVAEGIARAGALRDAGQFEQGLAVAEQIVDDAGAVPDPRFARRARLIRGELLAAAGRYDEAEQVDRDLYFDALAGSDDDTGARALLQLVRVIGDHQRRTDDGLAWSRHADATLRRLGDPPLRRAQWHFLEGIMASTQARSDDAIGHFERALALDAEVLGPDHIQVATDRAGLGSALALAGRFDEALVHQEQALAVTEAALGPDHPRVVNRLVNLGITYGRSGRGAQGVPYLERALPLAREKLGPEHPTTLLTVGVLGTIYLEIEEPGRALEVLEPTAAVIVEKELWNPNLEHLFSSLALAQRDLGRYDEALASLEQSRRCAPEGTEFPAVVVVNLSIEGGVHLRRGDPERALATYRESYAVRKRAGMGDVEMGEAALDFGRAYRALGRLDESAAALDEALPLLLAGFGPDAPGVAEALLERGQTELARGRPAVGTFEEAVAVAERAGTVESLGAAWFGLARALAATDPARARAAAERAREVFRTRAHLAGRAAEVDAWLARGPR